MKEHRISDIQLASFLYAKGIELLSVDHLRPRKEFIFKDELRIADLETGFWQDTIKIAPRKYMGAFKELKNKLYQ